MQNIVGSLVVGVLLLALGGCWMHWHFRSWKRHRLDPALDDRERRFYRRQFFRRVQTAALLMLLGVMIPLGDAWLVGANRRQIGMLTVYWLVVLLITLWIMLLAALDWVSSRAKVRSARVALAGLARQRQALEDEVARLRNQHRNGHG